MLRCDGPPMFVRSFFSMCFSLLLLCVVSMSMAACAENRVPLVYSAPAENMLPVFNAPSVCIVTFEDKRPVTTIGQRSNKTEFTTESDVREWFTQALGTEIARMGIVVMRAGSAAEAKKSGARFVITGSVDEVWITEKYMAAYETRMSSSALLKNGKIVKLDQRFSSNMSRRLVGSSVPRDILSDTVSDLARTMARAVYDQIQK